MKEPSLHAWITKHYLLSDNQIGELTKIIEIKMNWAYFTANQFWLRMFHLKIQNRLLPSSQTSQSHNIKFLLYLTNPLLPLSVHTIQPHCPKGIPSSHHHSKSQ